jgi:colanic acid biosynthesis glycosyl transferase WcaI
MGRRIRQYGAGTVRVLILSQHYAPEITAARFRLEAFAAGLMRRGHDVQVICPVPNHPRGMIEDGYRDGLVLRRRVDGAEVTYLRILTSPVKTFGTRMAYYGSYAAFASVMGAVGARPDVVIASSPPLSVAAVGTILATRHRVPLVADIRDLWPQSAVDVGELEPGSVVKAAERLERFVYRRANLVVTANDAFRRWIAERAPRGAAVEVIENGTTEELLEVGRLSVDRASIGLPDGDFLWAYAGNIGLAHGLEFAADAARILGRGYYLLVIGEGPRRAALQRRVADQPTVRLEGLMNPREAGKHLRAADVVLVSERQERTVSAKLYDVCAIGRPIVAACRGELMRIVESEQIGLAVTHGDTEAMASAIRRLRSDRGLCERLGSRAQEFARSHLRSRQADRLAQLVESLRTQG